MEETDREKMLREMEGEQVDEEDNISEIFSKWVKMRLRTGKKKMAEVE